jgi:hypothetical protein
MTVNSNKNSMKYSKKLFQVVAMAFGGLLALHPVCAAYPEPGNIYYGIVRDESGRQMGAEDNIRLIMQAVRNEMVGGRPTLQNYTVAEADVITAKSGEPNFVLRVSLDGGGGNRYRSDALREGESVKILLIKGGKTNELAGAIPAVGGRAAIQRVDTDLPCIDSDRDQLCDDWEIAYFENLTATNGSSDFDGDGLTDLEEHNRRSNPIDPNDPIPPFIIFPKPGPGSSMIVEWRRLPGKTYEVQSTRALGTPFAPLPPQNIVGNPANGSVQVSDPQAPVLFLRVVER